jgi:hypothetical protein
MRNFAIFIATLGSCWFFASHVQAGTVDPQSVTLEAPADGQVQQTLRIANDADVLKIYKLELSAVAFGASADELLFSDLTTERAAWIVLDRAEIVIDPKSEQSISVTISPDQTADGEILTFAVIATEQVVEQPGINVASGLASVFFVKVGETGAAQLHIDSFETVPGNVRKPPVRLAALITNLNSGLAEPQVGVVIRNIWGKEVAVVSLNPTGRRVPGYTNRVFSAEWEAEGLRFGPYTAELYVFPDSSSTTLTAATTVVLFPWRMLGISLVIVAVFLGAFYAFWRTRRPPM